jgi:hypothetical protein
MSDFLSRLLDRASSRVSSLERRPLSRFEPMAEAFGLAGGVPAALGEQEQTAQESAATAAVPQFDREPQGRELSPVFAPERAPAFAAEPAAPATPRPAMVPAVPTPAVPSVRIETQRAEPPPGGPVEPRITTREVSREMHSTVVVEKTAHSAASAPHEPVQPTRAAAAGIAPRSQPRSPQAPAVVPRTSRQTARATRDHAPPAAPEPVIEVTIGRIEVRAVPASAPTRATRPSEPKLNLEDYLKSRHGGVQ